MRSRLINGLTRDNQAPDTHLRVSGDDLEGLLDLLGRSTATHVQEVGRGATVKLDNVHSGHGQASSVHEAPDTACTSSIYRVGVR